MIRFYNWFICKLFKKYQIKTVKSPEAAFKSYCEENPSSKACRIYDI